MLKFNQISEDIKDSFDFIALITKLEIRPTSSGNDYFQMELTTKEGIMNAKKWKITSKEKEIIKNGTVIQGTAKVNIYRGELSLIVDNISPVDVDPDEFTLTVIENTTDLINEFNGYINSIENPDLKKIAEDVLSNQDVREEFYLHPAAKSVHHAEKHGLLYHTTRMMRAADALCKVYNKVENIVNRDLVITGILFHDIGKLQELEMTKSGAGEYTKYSLIGHIALGAMKVDEYRIKGYINEETALQLEHIILSHHGKLEFGSPVVPSTVEAVLVSMVDNMDAKICAVQNEDLRLLPGEMSKQGNFAMDNARIYNPVKI